MKIKFKTNKSALKGVRVKSNCIQRKQANRSHLLQHKQKKSICHLKISAQVNKADLSLIKSLL